MALMTKNVGPCFVYKDDTSLGKSFGGIKVTADETYFKSKADITGETARSKHVTGTTAMATGAITEITHEQFAAILGTTVDGSTTKAVTLKSRVGTDLRDAAAVYTLRPIVDGAVSTVEADFIYFPSGTIGPKVSLDINTGAQKAWGFEIEGHPVTAEEIATGGRLYNSGSPEYEENDLMRCGKATSV